MDKSDNRLRELYPPQLIDVFCSKLKIHSTIFNTENYWFYILCILRLLILLHLHRTVYPMRFDNQNEQERANASFSFFSSSSSSSFLSSSPFLHLLFLFFLISFLSAAIVCREALNHYCGFSFTTMCVCVCWEWVCSF